MKEIITQLKNGLIVSCQAEKDDPFNSPELIATFAKAAQRGGAKAIRTEGIENIRAVRRATALPIIGIVEGYFSDGWVCITPDFKDVENIIAAGADIVALDVTARKRPNGKDGIEFFDDMRDHFDVPFVADVATFEEGIRAAELGADMLATTLSGFTPYTEMNSKDFPDVQLIEHLSRAVKIPVIAQGKVWTPEQAKETLQKGAYAVVVGTAIARPTNMTKRFVDVIESKIQ